MAFLSTPGSLGYPKHRMRWLTPIFCVLIPGPPVARACSCGPSPGILQRWSTEGGALVIAVITEHDQPKLPVYPAACIPSAVDPDPADWTLDEACPAPPMPRESTIRMRIEEVVSGEVEKRELWAAVGLEAACQEPAPPFRTSSRWLLHLTPKSVSRDGQVRLSLCANDVFPVVGDYL